MRKQRTQRFRIMRMCTVSATFTQLYVQSYLLFPFPYSSAFPSVSFPAVLCLSSYFSYIDIHRFFLFFFLIHFFISSRIPFLSILLLIPVDLCKFFTRICGFTLPFSPFLFFHLTEHKFLKDHFPFIRIFIRYIFILFLTTITTRTFYDYSALLLFYIYLFLASFLLDKS